MGDVDVQELFRRAVADDDEPAMREGVGLMLGLAGAGGLSADREHRLRVPDFVMEMPQSGERIRGRDAMRALQEAFPAPPSIALTRLVGSGRVWVMQARADYGDEPWHVVVIFELTDDGLIARETRYYTGPLEAPGWRAHLVEPMA